MHTYIHTYIYIYRAVKMIHNQGVEWISSTYIKESSVYTEAHTMASGQDMLLSIDLGNIEDILDFSKPRIPIPTIIKSPMHPCEPCKPMTKEPVKMQPTVSNNEFSENDVIDHKTKPEQKRKFQCIVCGNKFLRSSQLDHHMSIHGRVKPYYCSVCRKRFSTREYMLTHFYTHRNDKVHYCCVCSEAYYDLERFSNHCRSHDDGLYIKIALDEPTTDSDSSDSDSDLVFDLQEEPLIIEDCVPTATSTEEPKPDSSVTMKEECIACVENPLYQSRHKAISINSNVATSHNDAESLMVSINVVHFLPSS